MLSNFKKLLVIQALGTLNDNLFRNAVTVYCTFGLIQLFNLSPEKLVPLAGIIYILPIFLFSDLMGQISDFYPKQKIIQIIKIFEAFVMLLVVIGFYFQWHNLIFCCLFLLGFHSAVFAPLKYSFTTEIVEPKELLKANSLIEAATFVCLVVGTLVGGYLILKEDLVFLFYVFILANSFFSVFSVIKIHQIKKEKALTPISFVPFSGLFKIFKKYKTDVFIKFEILSYAWFWLFVGAILAVLPTLTKSLFAADAFAVSIVISLFSIGIAIGAISTDRIFKGRLELGVVSYASLAMSFLLIGFSLFIFSVEPIESQELFGLIDLSKNLRFWIFQVFMLALSISFSFFIIPLFTSLQSRTKPEDKTLMFSVSNVLNSLFMIFGLSLSLGLQSLNWSVSLIFLSVAVLNLGISFLCYLYFPVPTLRMLGRFLCRVFYKFRMQNQIDIPEKGPLILVCNHVSFIDWLFIGSFFPRPVRFVMYYQFMNIPIAKYLFKQGGIIPIAGRFENKEIFDRAFQDVSEALKNEEVVCIFPEGELTKGGDVGLFKTGIEHVLNKDLVPILPMAIKGLWGSYFSYYKTQAMKGFPRPTNRKVNLIIGALIEKAEVEKELRAGGLSLKLRKKVNELFA